MNKHLLFIPLLAATLAVRAQNTFPSTGSVGIGTTTVHPSSILEVKSTTKGVLLPRLTLAQRNAIPVATTTTGLLIYQTDGTPGFYYHTGTSWKAVGTITSAANTTLSNLSTATAVSQHLVPGTTAVRDLGSATKQWRNLYLSGSVGVGTATPAGKFEVRRTDGQFVIAKFTNGATTGDRSAIVDIQNGDVTPTLWRYGVGGTGNGLGFINGEFYLERAGLGAVLSVSKEGNLNIGKDLNLGEALFLQKGLFLHSRGPENTFVGHLAGLTVDLISGSMNTGLGDRALVNNTTGSSNTATGASVLAQNTTGHHNTGSGYYAMHNNTSGQGNTAVGAFALDYNSVGDYNTALGLSADVSWVGLTNATVLGYAATVDASNKVRIGNTSVTSIGGQVAWTTFSDGRYKRNIREDVQGLPFINTLRPVTYTVDVQGLNSYYNNGRKEFAKGKRNAVDEQAKVSIKESEEEAAKVVYNGFVAQEVEQAAKKLNYEFSGVDKPQKEGGLYGLRYSDFVVPLVKAVQELSKENEDLKRKVAAMEDLKKQMEELRTLIIGNKTVSMYANGAYLVQASPNPSRGTTTIRYSVPDGAPSAKLVLTNANGQTLKEISLTTNGAGQVNLNTSALPSGVYTYTLWVEGRQADSKRLVVAK